jgi:hypothetical protein
MPVRGLMTPLRTVPATLLAAVALVVSPTDASASYAPPTRPGPPLSVPVSKLAAALQCTGTLHAAPHAPVLLVPGTSLNPSTDYGYGWEPALSKLGWPYCTVALPGNAMGDIQVAGEYVVYAIRTMYAAYRARIDIVGHSQGGMVPRWALRFWPDTRAMVDDLVACRPATTARSTRSRCARRAARRPSGSSARTPRSSPHSTPPRRPSRGSPTPTSTRTPTRSSSPTSGPPRPRRSAAGAARSPTWPSSRCARPTSPSISGSASTTTPPTSSRWTR